MLRKNVNTVTKNSSQTNMQTQSPVQSPALPNFVGVKGIRKVKNEDVYCLATKKNGNFIANGMVVKNCDSLRYALFTHFFGKEQGRMTAKDLDRLYQEAMGGSDLPAPFREPADYGFR